MEKFSQFLVDNWQYISSAIAAIFSIIIIIVKRRPKTMDDFVRSVDYALTQVASYCSSVEHPGDGEEKKRLVIKFVKNSVHNSLGRELTEKEISIIEKAASEQIEDVLSAPSRSK